MNAIAQRLEEVRGQVAAALANAGDLDREVIVIAVTKGHPAEVLLDVAHAGLLDVGENRVQEARGKISQTKETLRWHLVGHLQRNKAALAARLFETIHNHSVKHVGGLARKKEPLRPAMEAGLSGVHLSRDCQ